MRTASNDANSNNEYVSRPSAEGSEKLFYRQSGSEQVDSNDMSGIERRLKAMWSEYVEHQDKYGFDEKAKALKEKYFSHYQSYRRNKKWKQIISDND